MIAHVPIRNPSVRDRPWWSTSQGSSPSRAQHEHARSGAVEDDTAQELAAAARRGPEAWAGTVVARGESVARARKSAAEDGLVRRPAHARAGGPVRKCSPARDLLPGHS